jgi:ferric iron reductase protein FhuF
LALAEISVNIGGDGLPSAFLVRNPDVELPADVSGAERFRGLREAYLTPLIAAWSAQTRLSPRLFWSNVERYLTWLLDGLPTPKRARPAGRGHAACATICWAPPAWVARS